MSETVLINITIEIIKKINELQKAIEDASTILPDQREELRTIYDELGSIAERIVEILGR